jgi:hypothetical protein
LAVKLGGINAFDASQREYVTARPIEDGSKSLPV